MLTNINNPTLKNLSGYMFLSYSITTLLVFFGLIGEHIIATDIAIIQGASLASFYVLSSDARHLILTEQISAKKVLFFRLVCLPVVILIMYTFSVVVGGVSGVIFFSLLLRRSIEWLCEVYVTELERKNIVWSGWILQPLIFFLLIAQIIFTDNLWLIWFWAISPLFSGYKFIFQSKSYKFWNINLENILSTAVIGLTGYIQRILIIFLVGKEFSGMIFPGFAIGSFLGSMIANVAGPTLHNIGLLYSKLANCIVFLLFISGIFIFLASETIIFQTIGISIVGGSFMVSAQQIRLKYLEKNSTLDIDLFFQFSLLVSIILIDYLFNTEGMMFFYLIGSLIAYLFYKGRSFQIIFYKYKKIVFISLSLILIFPIFFQLNGQIYNEKIRPIIDNGGILLELPLPLSILASILGLLLFSTNFKKSKPALITISSMYILFIISMLVYNYQINTLVYNYQINKYFLFFQFLVPLSALLFGSYLDNEYKNLFAKVVLYFLIFFISFHLVSTWFQGRLSLTHNLYFFSVYSHYEFVPIIISTLYAWSMIELNNSNYIKWFFYLSPFIGMYIAAGNSTTALFGLVLFTLLFAFSFKKNKFIFYIPLIIIFSILGYFSLNSILGEKIYINNNLTNDCQSHSFEKNGVNTTCVPGVFHGKIFDETGRLLIFSQEKNLLNIDSISVRADLASEFFNRIKQSKLSEILFGHPPLSSRNGTSSFHNYYFDLIYNFGFLVSIPFFILIVYTIVNIIKSRNSTSNLIWFLGIILFLIIIDNNLKTTLKQPYPAIVVFFLWGILINSSQSKYSSQDKKLRQI